MKMLSSLMRWAAISGGAASLILFFLIGNEKKDLEERIQKSAESTREARRERDDWAARNATMKTKWGALENSLEGERAKASLYFGKNNLSLAEISRLENALSESENRVLEKEEELRRLKKTFIDSTAPRTFESGFEERDEALREAEELKEKIAALEGELAHYKNQAAFVNRPGKPVEGQSVASPPPPLKGTPRRSAILRIDQEKSVVAIGAGSRHGIDKAMKISLSDASGELARIEISNVQPDFSIGRILTGYGNPQRLQSGMEVTLNIQ